MPRVGAMARKSVHVTQLSCVVLVENYWETVGRGCKLFSEATWHVAPKFITVLSAHFASPEERVSQLLAEDSKKPCFSSLDLVTLEKKIHEVNEEIVSRLAKTSFPSTKA